jgi:hypothetical protein
VYLFGQFFPIVGQSLQNAPVIGNIFQRPGVERFMNSFGSSSVVRNSDSRLPPV